METPEEFQFIVSVVVVVVVVTGQKGIIVVGVRSKVFVDARQ